MVSDSRTEKTDISGDVAETLIIDAGHKMAHRTLIPNDRDKIIDQCNKHSEPGKCVIFCGGTGLGKHDLTVETIEPLLDKKLDGFGEAFRRFSWDEIGVASIMSRAIGGSRNGAIVICTPGSPNAVSVALERILLPELSHLVYEANR